MKLFKKAISLCLALMMVVTLVPMTVVQTEAATTVTFEEMLERAEAIVNYTWVPSQRIYTWNGNKYNGKTYFEAGQTVTGMPYTLFSSELGFDSLLSLIQYKNKVTGNYSVTEYCNSVGADRIGPAYGSCCATFVSEVFGGAYMNGSNPRFDSVYGIEHNSAYGTTYYNVTASNIRSGDALSNSTTSKNGGHIVWIGEVTSTTVTIYEQTPPVAKKTVVPKTSVNSSGYLIHDGAVYSTVTRSNQFVAKPSLPTVDIPEGEYVFHCVRAPEKVLDIQYDSKEKGANVQLYENLYNTVQKFRVVNMGDYYCIQSVHSGMWLDIAYPYNEDNCNIQLWDTNTSQEQKWVFQDAGDGNVYIKSLYGMYLDTGGPTDNGTNIRTWHFDGSTSQQWKLVKASADLGSDFTAVILNYESWKPIENSYTEGDKPPIRIGAENNYANQLWRFIRQSDGSYRIASCYDGKYMDVRDASTEPGAVVQTCVETSSDAQKWCIFESPNGYVFKSKLNDCVLDLKNNDSATGTILQTFGWNGTGAQRWAIYRGDECKLSGPELTTVQKPTGEVVFNWTNVYGEKGYDIKIWRDELWEGEAYHIEWGVSSGWSIKLPDGTYHAYVDARNYYETKMSNEVTFTVSHVHSYSSYVTPPTCTTQGYTTYTCITCNDSYKADYIDETGHSYSYKVTKDPTTSATGTVTGTCSKCKGTTTATLPKLNTTDYTYSVVKEATCIEMGLCRYTWSDPRYGSFNFEVTIPQSDPELGDVDADAKITIGDVSALLNFLSDTTRKPGGVTDINQDGVITVGDVTMLLNMLAGTIE